ncbi:MAG: hypothetical protein CVT79_10705 [Alphaproteobacteria bacterium HGW-Alphaproteobacteria-18]|nr:MAG: hypothetical protein CVT79_10705 [Alphaproteobacteria bacterium HGW-Alphaproteobacteria-18]
MLETISAIGTILAKSLSAVKSGFDWNSSTRKKRLGNLINLIYIELAETICTAEQIVGGLNSFANGERNWRYDGEYGLIIEGVDIDDLIADQARNLVKLEKLIDEYSQLLKNIDVDAFLRLQQFCAFKGAGLTWLAVSLSRGRVPFSSLGQADLESLIELSGYMLFEENENAEHSRNFESMIQDTMANWYPWYSTVGEIASRTRESEFHPLSLFSAKAPADSSDELGRFDETQIDHLKLVLKRCNFADHLQNARSALTKIREFIEDNFSIADIMIDEHAELLKRSKRS